MAAPSPTRAGARPRAARRVRSRRPGDEPRRDRRPLAAAVLARRDIVSHNWSPDGTKLVLEIATARPSGRAPRSRQSDLAIVNADGYGDAPPDPDRRAGDEPRLVAGSQLIAFTSDRHAKRGQLERHGPAFEIYTMRANGTDIRRITRNRVPDLHPDWQPLP